jgi:hypothetical protein
MTAPISPGVRSNKALRSSLVDPRGRPDDLRIGRVRLAAPAPSEKTSSGASFKEISEDVVNELDAEAARRAQATPGEGAEAAEAAGCRCPAASPPGAFQDR